MLGRLLLEHAWIINFALANDNTYTQASLHQSVIYRTYTKKSTRAEQLEAKAILT